MAFKATRAKSGLFEIHGIEAFIEQKVSELKKALGIGGKKAEVKAAPKPKAAAKAPAKKATGADPLDALLSALNAHPKKAALIKAGKKKDQLLRSLIPLYVAGDIDVTSGITSKFWAKHGVKYSAPNVAKAFRTHPGNVKRSSKGLSITPAGIKYVDAAL